MVNDPRVTFACSAKASYTRNETVLAALRQHYSVRAISSDLNTYPFRLATVLPRALLASVCSDVLVAGFLAQPLAPLLAARRTGAPVVVDAFISLYETLVEDRRSVSSSSPLAYVARWLDASMMRRADRILTDTRANAEYLAQTNHIDIQRFSPLYIGANESLFYPRPKRSTSEKFRAFYYATYLPLHGVDVIVKAARELAAEGDVQFQIVGDGPERRRVERLASKFGLTNIDFHAPVACDRLPELIAESDVCLGGHFNAKNAKARRVVPGKVFQFLAMARPTIAGDCPGVREALRDGEEALLVPMGDPEKLAQAILRFKHDAELRRHIAAGGAQRFQRDFSFTALGATMQSAIEQVLSQGKATYADAA